MVDMKNLTAKQEMFCKEYLIDLNATQAAIRAGYSEKTARSVASENLTKPDIQERIADLKKERKKRLEISSDRVLLEVYRLAMGNIFEYFNISDSDLNKSELLFKKLSEIPEATQVSTSEISFDSNGKIKLKMHPKSSELEKLMRHLGLYEIDNTQKRESILDDIPLAQRINIVKSILAAKNAS